MANTPDDKISFADPHKLSDLISYNDGAVVSRTLVKGSAGTITLFAFDANQGLSEHSAPFDAFVEVVDGQGEFTIGGKKVEVGAGQFIIMPANIPHAVNAVKRFKMLLVMIKG